MYNIKVLLIYVLILSQLFCISLCKNDDDDEDYDDSDDESKDNADETHKTNGSKPIDTDREDTESMGNDNDDDYKSYDDNDYDESVPNDIDNVNAKEINSLINRIVNNIIPKDDETPIEIHSNVSYTINDTLSFLINFHDIMKSGIEAKVKIFMPALLKMIYEFDLSQGCSASLFQLLNDFREQKISALKFIDSSAHISTGFLAGTVADYGEYDECLNIKIKDSILRGKYCTAKLRIPLPPKPKELKYHISLLNISGTILEGTFFEELTKNLNSFYIMKGFRAGICIPSECSAQELETIANRLLYPVSKLHMTIDPICDTLNEPMNLNDHQFVAILTILTLLCVTIISTIIDWIYTKLERSKIDNREPSEQSLIIKIIIAFSIIRNTQNLFKPNDNRSKTLSSIHGIRVLAILWILVGHVYLMQFFQVFHVIRKMRTEINRAYWYRYQWLKAGAFYQVETFFLISGVIVSYVLIDVLRSKNGRFNYYIFVIHRWLRYTPALIGLILFYMLLPLMSSGPIFKENIAVIYKPCEEFWYRNLLYYNNFYDATGNCATHTWFLAVDFQLYILSPVFIFLLLKLPKIGIFITVLSIIGSAFLPLLAEYFGGNSVIANYYSMDMLIDERETYDVLQHLYWATYQHVTPYLIGILLGYVIQVNHEFKLWKPIELFFWALSASMTLFSIFWTTFWINPETDETDPSLFERKAFLMTYKILFVSLTSWIILMCAANRGGIINQILSWKGFVPLSRLTYCFYLVSLIPIILRCYSVKYVQQFDDFYNLSASCLCTIIAIILAYFLYILFECPFGNLHKLLMENLEKLFLSNESHNKKVEELNSNEKHSISIVISDAHNDNHQLNGNNNDNDGHVIEEYYNQLEFNDKSENLKK